MSIEENIAARVLYARFIVCGDSEALIAAEEIATRSAMRAGRLGCDEVPTLCDTPELAGAWIDGQVMGSEPIILHTSHWIAFNAGAAESRRLIGRTPQGFVGACEISWYGGEDLSVGWSAPVATFQQAAVIAAQLEVERTSSP